MSTVRRPCPRCDRGPPDTALAVTVDERGTVEYCHRCGYTSANNRAEPLAKLQKVAPKAHRLWQDLAAHLWDKAQPVKGTLAERYLQSRNCMLPPADGDLRYLPAGGEHPAAMVARITDAVTCEPISLHFTQLDAAGNKIGRRLLAGHRKAGGVVRLWPDDTVTYSLGIAEGIETALSLAHGHAPVWAAIDASNLAAFPVLAGIETLVISTDGDDAGIESAATCAGRWNSAGKHVLLVAASEMGCDLNDEVRA